MLPIEYLRDQIRDKPKGISKDFKKLKKGKDAVVFDHNYKRLSAS